MTSWKEAHTYVRQTLEFVETALEEAVSHDLGRKPHRAYGPIFKDILL